MAEIYVQSSEAMQGCIDELQMFLGAFTEKAQAIDTEHKNLITKWEGDASTAFEQHYMGEKQNFDVFAQAVTEYINALKQILQTYETAEEMNKQIASE